MAFASLNVYSQDGENNNASHTLLANNGEANAQNNAAGNGNKKDGNQGNGTNQNKSVLTWKRVTEESNKNANVIEVTETQIAFLKNLISKQYKCDSVDKVMQDSIDGIQQKLKSFHSFQEKVESGEFEHTQLWTRILLFILLGMALGLIVFDFFLHKKQHKDSNRIDKKKGEIESLKDEIERLNKNIQSQGIGPIEKKVIDLKNKNDELLHKVTALEDLLKERNTELSVGFRQQASPRLADMSRRLYADSIIDGMFSHVKEQENDDTVFVLKLKSETKASITLCEQAYNRIIANASYLEGCEKQIIGHSSVEIVHEGEAERGFNGKWRVVTPLKVEIR